MADSKLTALSEATSANITDADVTYVVDGGTSKKVTIANLRTGLITSATEDTTPAADGDLVTTYDLSATTSKKVTIENLVKSYSLAGYRNRLINNNFTIWQEATSGTAPLAAYTYTAEMWTVDPSGAQVTWSQGTDPYGFSITPGSLAIAGASGNTGISVRQRIEAKNVVDLIGKKVTVSFLVYGNATSSATCTPVLYYANSADNFTAFTEIEEGTAFDVINGSFTAYSFTFDTLPTNAKNGLMVAFRFSAIGADESVAIAATQVEAGLTATTTGGGR